MSDNVINFEEVLEEKDEALEEDEALEKALEEASYYQKKYFSCLKDNEMLQEMNETMKQFIEQIEQIAE